MKPSEFSLDFIGVGAAKSATTWIAHCLSQHPQICFPKNIKEMHFFNKKHIAFTNVVNNTYHTHGMEWYKRQFTHCNSHSKKGEFSVSYLSDPVACKRIKQHFPDTKIIVSLRNPVKRVHSAFLHGLRYGDFKKGTTLREALDIEPYQLEQGKYAKHLKLYLKEFKEVKVILQEEIQENPQKVMKDLFEFLEVDKSFIPPSLYEKNVNKGGTPKYPFINRGLTQTNKYMRKHNLDWIFPYLEKWGVYRALDTLRVKNVTFSPLPSLSDADKDFLTKYYKSDIKELEKILKRDLSHWINDGTSNAQEVDHTNELGREKENIATLAV